jgi:hypothetical protein
MGFFTKAIEYNKMAKALGALFVMANELASKVEENKEVDYSEDLFLLAYLSRIEIVDRVEEYKWGMLNKITVPLISKSTITLMHAFNQTIGFISLIATNINMLEKVQNILEKGERYNEMDKKIPSHLKNMLNR